MRVAVLGFGNQELYEKIGVEERCGGEPPFGGAGMALDFARAGHEVVLSDPFLDEQDPEHISKLEEAGVQLTTDDSEAVQDAEIIILFTPFGTTEDIVRNIVEDIPEGALVCTTCTCSPFEIMEVLTEEGRKVPDDVGTAYAHPAGIPGSECQEVYIVAYETGNGKVLATEDQVEALLDLLSSTGKKVVRMPVEVASCVGDMSVFLLEKLVEGVKEFYRVANALGAPEEMIDNQVMMVMYTVASLVEVGGVRGMLATVREDLVECSAENMRAFADVANDGGEIDLSGEPVEEFAVLPANAVRDVALRMCGDRGWQTIQMMAWRTLYRKL